MLKPTNTAGPSVGGAPIAESPWTTFTDAAGTANFHAFGAIRNRIVTRDEGWARRHRLGAYASTSMDYPNDRDRDPEPEPKIEYGPPTGALLGFNDAIYWCQPKVWGIRVADATEITIWKSRITAHLDGGTEFPLVFKTDGAPTPIVVALRVHAWQWRQHTKLEYAESFETIEQQALYAVDDRTGKIILIVGDQPVYDTEPEKFYELAPDRWRYHWVERPRTPIYIDGKRQKIIGSRFEARYDPEGWEPRWFRAAS